MNSNDDTGPYRLRYAVGGFDHYEIRRFTNLRTIKPFIKQITGDYLIEVDMGRAYSIGCVGSWVEYEGNRYEGESGMEKLIMYLEQEKIKSLLENM